MVKKRNRRQEVLENRESVPPAATPQNLGETSIEGHMTDPEADDDILEDAHLEGLALDADDEHPKPVDIAGDVDKAEKAHRED